MTSSKLLSLWQFMKEERYSAGNIIYSEKDPCSHLYFIKSGEIEISRDAEQAKIKKTAENAILKNSYHCATEKRTGDEVEPDDRENSNNKSISNSLDSEDIDIEDESQSPE